MANPQPEHGFVKLANEIWNEIIRRDFSKRQKDIILFIWRLSYGCQKKTALVPRLKDFELCGIGQQNIRKELEFLSSCKVITWEKENNIFSVNKDYEQWQISPVRGWDEDKFRELISKNLDSKTSQNKKNSTSQNKKFEDVKKVVKVTYTSQNKKSLLLKLRSYHFLKQEVRRGSNPWCCKVKRLSKDNIKDNIKDSSSSLDHLSEEDTEKKTSGSNQDFSFGYLYRAYEQNFSEGGKVTPFETEEFGTLYDDYGGEWMLKAMREASKHKVLTLAYIHGILKGYQKRGGPTIQLAGQGNTSSPTIAVADLENDPIMERIRKADEQRLAQYGIS